MEKLKAVGNYSAITRHGMFLKHHMCKTGSAAQAARACLTCHLMSQKLHGFQQCLSLSSTTLKGNFILACFYFLTLVLIKF